MWRIWVMLAIAASCMSPVEAGAFERCDKSKSGSLSGGEARIRLRLAGARPNSDATRIMITACRFAGAGCDGIGKPVGDCTMILYLSICSNASDQSCAVSGGANAAGDFRDLPLALGPCVASIGIKRSRGQHSTSRAAPNPAVALSCTVVSVRRSVHPSSLGNFATFFPARLRNETYENKYPRLLAKPRADWPIALQVSEKAPVLGVLAPEDRTRSADRPKNSGSRETKSVNLSGARGQIVCQRLTYPPPSGCSSS
jgi:hypothetical protein